MTDEKERPHTGTRLSQTAASAPLSTYYTIVRSLLVEGTYPGDTRTGGWPISALRAQCGWGAVLETDWPEVPVRETWPPPEPPGLDAKAKELRTHHYQRVRSARECCIVLGHIFPVAAAFEITGQWFGARNGVIPMPDPDEPIVGTHCVTLLGFDRLHMGFDFANSWGQDWGHRGFGLLPFEYFDRHVVCAWTMHGIGPLPGYYACKGIEAIGWQKLDCLGNSLHGGDVVRGREVYDGTHDERMGWTFAVHRDGFLDVEEFFVRPQYRRQGVGTQLVEMLHALAAELKRPLRLWVPFADWTESNIPLVDRIARKLGLKLFHANVRWAAAMALDPSALPPARKEEHPWNEY